MPFTDPFGTSPAQAPEPTPAGGGFTDPFAQPGAPSAGAVARPQKPVSADRSSGILGPVLGAGKWALGEVGAGVKDLLRGLRVPQQATAVALADFLATNHRLPSTSEWLQAASSAVGSDEQFDTVLKKFGLPDTLSRKIGGMILDVVADPLWIVTPAKVAKLAGIPKMLDAAKATAPGKALLEAPMFGKAMRYVANPEFNLPAKFVQARNDLRVGVSRGWQAGLELGTEIQRKLSPEEQTFVTRYMESGSPFQFGEAVTGKALSETPEQAKLLADAASKGLNVDEIRRFGQIARTADLNQLRDLVDIGVIPQKVVDPFHNLPGSYLLGIGPDQERVKAMNELFHSNPSEYYRRQAQLSNAGLPLAASHVRREYRFWEDPEGFIKKLAQSDPGKAKQLEAWWRTRAGMSQSGSYRPFALNFGFLQSRDPAITEIIRDAMGEIREAAHPVATSMIEGRRFVELHGFLNNVAKNFAVDSEEAARRGYKGLKFIESRNIWGPLAGKWLPQDIADEILKTVGKDQTGLARLLRKFRIGVGWWKYGKIVLSPASHARIILHNALLWDWSGAGGIMKPHRMMQALRAISQGAKNPLYKEMMDSGVVLHNTFVEQMLDDLITRDPSLIAEADTWAGVARNLEVGSKNIFRTFVGRPAEALLAFEERLFKAATFAEYRAQGKPIEEAARMTNEALLNYKKMPEFWNLIRGYGIVPFVAFPLQATSRVTRAVVQRPAVIGKYGKIFRDIETARSGLTPNQIRSEESVLPPDMDQGLGWLRLGKNPDGTVRYLNLSYVMPLWILPQSYQSVKAMMPGGTPENRPWTSAIQGGFVNISAYPIAKAMIEGVDPFTGKKFQSTHDFLMYLYNFAAPPMAGVYAEQMWAAARGKPVNPLSKTPPKKMTDVLARSFLAWSTRDLDPNMERVWRMRELQQEIRDVDKEIARIGTAPYITPEERDRLMSEQIDKIRAIVSALSRVGQTEIPQGPDSTLPAAAAFPEPVPTGAPAPSGGYKDPFKTP